MNRPWGDEYRTTVVCIDAWDNDVPVGRFYNPYLPEGRSFSSLTQFLTEMEQVLDLMDFPRSFTAVRSFFPAPGQRAEPPTDFCQTGKLATFALRILFRQNVSWQGSVAWLEGKQEQSFRSALELVLLLSNALSLEEVS